jgi:hypothetical protein
MSDLIPLPKPKMSACEVIDFVVDYYGADLSRRSVAAGERRRCLYNGAHGRHCAFALFVENPQDLIEGESCCEQDEACMRVEVRKLGASDAYFWLELQQLHDEDLNWDSSALNGLSQQGNATVAKLKADYAHLTADES